MSNHDVSERLRAAVLAGDQPAARLALGLVLQALGGESDSKMFAYKSSRAIAFRLVDGRVLYNIERHPGTSWLTHRVQTRFVDLAKGHEGVESESVNRLTQEDLVRFAEEERIRVPATPAVFREDARAAVGYASDLARADTGEMETGDIAIGWVALIARHRTLPRVWRGRAGHIQEALRAHYGGGVDDDALGFIAEDAAAVLRATLSLWSEVLNAAKTTKRKK